MKNRTLVNVLGAIASATLFIASAWNAPVAAAPKKTVSMNRVTFDDGTDFYMSPYTVEYTGNVRLDVLMVESIEKAGDVWRMVSIDQNGFTWESLEEDGDMFAGDIIAVMFDDMGTTEIFDDRIIDWTYCGWVDDTAAWVK